MIQQMRERKKKIESDIKKQRTVSEKSQPKLINHFSSASSKREDADPGGGEGVKVGLVHPYPWYRVGVAQL